MPTFAEFFERWHSECVKRECAPKTAERYYELGQYAVRLFGAVPLDKLDTMQLQAAVNQLSDHGGVPTKQHPKGRPLAAKTIQHICGVVQGCLDQAVDWDILTKNPMLKVKKPKVPKRRPKIVDSTGFASLAAHSRTLAIYPVIVLGMATGMRRGELLALEWSDLDWANAMLEVSKSLEETRNGPLRIKSTKSGETRRFAIPADVLEILRAHHLEQLHHKELCGSDYANLNLIFCRPDGHYYSPDKMGTRIRGAMLKAGLSGVSLHSLRHSHASELLSKGVPITAVSERLGHASPNITLGIYSHALPADDRLAAEVWSKAMGDALKPEAKGGGLSLVITEEMNRPATGRESVG